ncbi:Retrovirus-related Pol polyprotein from transposon TNT 1-94 [Linum grandiflorum]
MASWHRRLAHPHESLLRRLVASFDLPVTSNKLESVCASCQLGKSHRLHLSSTHLPSSRPFELIYSDVWGPSPNFSLNGNRYFVLFVDDCTKYVWVYFLSHKSQVSDTFQRFHKMVVTQFSTTIRALQSDGGGEYKALAPYLTSQGIQHRISCPYTPEQNGAVERRNRIIVEKGLSLLAHSSLPNIFWEHAFKTATYLHNRTITPTLQYKSPYQCLYDSVPDYSFLKTFGCLCYPYLRPYTTNKMDFRSLPCIFLGYSSTHKGYLCYHQPNSRLYIARHVIFNEEVFPYTPHSSTSSSASQPSTPAPNSLLQQAHQSPPPQPSPGPTPPTHTPQPTPPLSPPTQPQLSPPTQPPNPPTPPPISTTAKYTQPSTSHYRPAPYNQHRMQTRAATNSLKPKTFSTTLVDDHFEPKTFREAIKHTRWRRAMKFENDALIRNGTWSLVPRPINVNLVGSKWIFRNKYNSDGSLQRHKARLVAQGYSQRAGVDFHETFSPVVKPTTIRVVLSIALSKGWTLRQLDINNVFLNGDLSEEVYMAQPKGFEHPDFPNHVCRLHKAIYGLKQAPRAWFNKLKSYLVTNGYHGCSSDTSLFVNATAAATTYVLVYVDDIIITDSDSAYIASFIAALDRTFALKDMGKLHHFLGLDIQHTKAGLQLSQTTYIRDILKRTNMLNSSPMTTPADPQKRLLKSATSFEDPHLYRQIVGSLQYATITRPDITYSVNKVCQYMHNPTQDHWQAVKRILRYLNATLDQSLQYVPTSATRLLAFSDAGWVSDYDDSRSQYGYAIYHGTNLVSWTSRKQKVVARSSTEAEYRSLAYTTAELMWLDQLLRELHNPMSAPPLLYCDNVGAIFMSKNPVISTRSKHVALDFHFIREQVEAGALHVSYISTVDQIADIFTKPLPRARLADLRHKLQVRPALELAGG